MRERKKKTIYDKNYKQKKWIMTNIYKRAK